MRVLDPAEGSELQPPEGRTTVGTQFTDAMHVLCKFYESGVDMMDES